MHADQDSGNWLTHGGNWQETRYSKLTDINANNVAALKPAWSAEFDTTRGQEATPHRGGRRDVRQHLLEQGVCPGRRDRSADLVLRSEGSRHHRRPCLLRCGQPRRRRLRGQGVPRLARRPIDRARRCDAASPCGRCACSSIRACATRAPVRRARRAARSSSATPDLISADADLSPPTMRQPAGGVALLHCSRRSCADPPMARPRMRC